MAVFEHMSLHVAIAGFCKPDFDNGSSFRFSTHCLAFYFCFIYNTFEVGIFLARAYCCRRRTSLWGYSSYRLDLSSMSVNKEENERLVACWTEPNHIQPG